MLPTKMFESAKAGHATDNLLVVYAADRLNSLQGFDIENSKTALVFKCLFFK